MAGKIKGITIEFRGDTTSLDKALRKIRQDSKGVDTALREVNKSLKFNPGNTELLTQKQTLLRQKVKQTEDSLKELKNTQKQMDDAGVDEQSQEYMKLRREIIETESKLKHFNEESKKLDAALSPLGQFSSKMQDVGTKITSAGQAMKGLSLAAAGVLATMGGLTYKSAVWADDLNTMSKQYSLSTQDLQKYAISADLVDVEVDTIAKTHQKLKKQMDAAREGTGASAEAFQNLGVDVLDANGQLRDGDEVWQEVIAALGDMENETERDAVAMQLMGKSASELNPLIEDGGETYKRVSDIFSKYGLDYVDQDTLDAANEFNDSIDTIKAIGLVTLQNLGATLAGYLAPALETVVGWVGKAAEWLSKLDPKVLTAIAAIAGVVAILSPLLIGIGKVAFAISSITGLMATAGVTIGGLMSTMLPIVAIIAAVVAAGVLLYKNWDTIKQKAQELWEKIKTVFAGIRDTIKGIWDAIKAKTTAVWNGIKTAVMVPVNAVQSFIQNAVARIKSIWDGLSSITGKVRDTFQRVKDFITSPIQKAKDIVGGAIDWIKNLFPVNLGRILDLKLPHFHVDGGKAPWGIGGAGQKPSFSVDWYASGAIFDRPSVIGVGEAGPEAVIPLDKLNVMLSGMADSIVNGMSTNMRMQTASPGVGTVTIPIYLYPSGPKMGEETVRMYDKYSKMLGGGR